MNSGTYSGFVSLVGRPNVGKSTLTNALVGEKVAIVSNKPQTTRNKIRGILTRDDYQIIFIDTPGLHRPTNKLGAHMVKSAEESLREADVTLYLVEPDRRVHAEDHAMLERLGREGGKPWQSKTIIVINKIDTVEKPTLLQIIGMYASIMPYTEIVPVSALRGENTQTLIDVLRARLPEGPFYFTDDIATDQMERQMVSEIIREKALYFLRDEIPHGVAVAIMSMRKRPRSLLVDIEATVYCEKDSHKGMVIGKNGEMLKRIGSAARRDGESLLGSPMNIQLWVKVKQKWRDDDHMLKVLGYDG